MRKSNLKTAVKPLKTAVFGAFAAVACIACAEESVDAYTTRLNELKAAGIVDDDTYVYLPLDTLTANKGEIENYAYNADIKKTAILTTFTASKNTTLTKDALILGESCSETNVLRNGWFTSQEIENTASYLCQRPETNDIAIANTISWFITIDDIENGQHTLWSDNLTIEGFFKFGPENKSDVKFLSVNSSYMKNGKTTSNYALYTYISSGGKLHTYNYSAVTNDSGIVTNFVKRVDTRSNCFDSKWHHFAVVYNKSANTLKYYWDYNEIGSYSAFYPLISSTLSDRSDKWMINGYGKTPSACNMDGGIDALRITKRALQPYEFLTSDKSDCTGETDTLAWISFEDGTGSAWPYKEYRSAGPDDDSRYVTTDMRGNLIKDEKGVLRTGNTTAFVIATNYNGYTISSSDYVFKNWMATEGFTEATIEFFAKGREGAKNYNNIVGLKGTYFDEKNNAKTSDYILQIRMPSTATNGCYQCYYAMQTGGNSCYDIKNTKYPTPAKDGKWHHVAVTAKQDNTNLVIKCYLDYELTYSKKRYDVSLPTNAANVYLNVTCGMCGLIDEIRVSKKALEPEMFLHAASDNGLFIIYK